MQDSIQVNDQSVPEMVPKMEPRDAESAIKDEENLSRKGEEHLGERKTFEHIQYYEKLPSSKTVTFSSNRSILVVKTFNGLCAI